MLSTSSCYFQFGPGQKQQKFWPVFAFTTETDTGCFFIFFPPLCRLLFLTILLATTLQNAQETLGSLVGISPPSHYKHTVLPALPNIGTLITERFALPPPLVTQALVLHLFSQKALRQGDKENRNTLVVSISTHSFAKRN